ncbi:polysialyltransferase family glycosyltransferase [Streptomyces sp. P9(2023)]|uniref:polysialyltransferase family glycosyltransferase n=1 Tax=Streptomyces sp. P9(2023) TaxID=3064394 RepID=UPI0028F4412C|nr:polysialyltransferase family glycosyltransferase [Streptomyces sp. P9(2023)]MDT9690391.1 polysialyltransferase family glycosyltransferase [Streptomyces sp. P9(2023)]
MTETTANAPTPTAGPRTQIFEVSTLYGASTLAAAIDAGQFGAPDDARRILLISNNAAIPETALRLETMTGYDRIATRFDEVIDWNEAIHPHHPATWAPRPEEAPLWQRVFRTAWELGTGPVELIVESIQVNPAKALAAVFAESGVEVYADGLMSYGPTREELPQSIACRVRRLLHLDLVPGLRPLLLSEYGVEPELVPDDAFRGILAEIAEAAEGDPMLTEAVAAEPTALLLGQYLAALGILSAEEEEELHVRMLRGAAAAGHTSVIFKPHPTAPASYSTALNEAADEAGVRLTVLDGPLLAETFYERCRPRLVVGCFSTAMVTASVYYGVPIARVGTDTVLERLTPYENSNRVPLTVVDHIVPDLETGSGPAVPGAGPATLTPLVRAVGFCMQARLHPLLRDETAAFIEEHRADGAIARYFDRERLTKLALPGGDATRGTASRLRRTLARSGRD